MSKVKKIKHSNIYLESSMTTIFLIKGWIFSSSLRLNPWNSSEMESPIFFWHNLVHRADPKIWTFNNISILVLPNILAWFLQSFYKLKTWRRTSAQNFIESAQNFDFWAQNWWNRHYFFCFWRNLTKFKKIYLFL